MRILISLATLPLLCACAAARLEPNAGSVILADAPPAGECRYLGEVEGAQGNFWTAQFTRDQDLVRGARNELRNAAWSLGANYVAVEVANYSHNTGEVGLGGTYSVVLVGSAYRCENPRDAARSGGRLPAGDQGEPPSASSRISSDS